MVSDKAFQEVGFIISRPRGFGPGPGRRGGEGGVQSGRRLGGSGAGGDGPTPTARVLGQRRVPPRRRTTVWRPPEPAQLEAMSTAPRAGCRGSRSRPGSLDPPGRREGAGGPETMGGGRESSFSRPGGGRRARAQRGRGGREASGVQGRRPPKACRADAGGSARRDGGRALTLTKSSMTGSLSSSFSPFSGIDNAMAGSATLRGRRRRLLLLRGLLGLRAPAALRCASLDSPGVELASGSAAQHRPTPRARLEGGPSPSHFKPRGGDRGRGLAGGGAKALRLRTPEETGRPKPGGGVWPRARAVKKLRLRRQVGGIQSHASRGGGREIPPGGRSLTPPPAAARARLRSCCWRPAR